MPGLHPPNILEISYKTPIMAGTCFLYKWLLLKFQVLFLTDKIEVEKRSPSSCKQFFSLKKYVILGAKEDVYVKAIGFLPQLLSGPSEY